MKGWLSAEFVRAVELGNGMTVVLDVLAWTLVHIIAGYAAHRAPLRVLHSDHGVLRLRRFERDGRVYERLGIRRWKDRLPEAGAFFTGGVSKKRIPTRSEGGLARFVIETRRAELAHWWALAALPLFVLFNPLYAMPIMVVYALAANLPCVVVQRYNRARLGRVTGRTCQGDRVDAAARSRSLRRTTGSSMP